MEIKPIIGVSSCLMGEEVRYDGGHKRCRFITDDLAPYVRFTVSCPEAAIGLGIPRPPIRLAGDFEAPEVVGVKDASINVTRQLVAYSQERAKTVGSISGYIFKKDSPSCGMRSVKVYPPNGAQPQRKGQGVFARAIMNEKPYLPVEDEGRLNDSVIRENFINRVFVYHHWQQLMLQKPLAKDLIHFHSQHKYLVMAHSQAAYKRLGQMLGQQQGKPIDMVAQTYISELMTALSRKVTRVRHINVMQHMLGYLKKRISGEDKAEMQQIMNAYRREEIPLIVPMTMLQHYFRVYPDPYINSQVYLKPAPAGLGLRNQI